MEAPIAKEAETATLLSPCEDLMAIVPNLCVHDSLLVVLPEPLNPASTFVSIAHIVTPCTLNPSGHVMPVAIPHGFQCEKLPRIIDQIKSQRRSSWNTVSGFLINALLTPVCHSSFAIPTSFKICSHPDFASPAQIYSPAYEVFGDNK